MESIANNRSQKEAAHMYQERSSAYKNYNENSEDYDLKPSAYTRTNSNNNAGASSSRRRRAVEPKSPSPAQDPVIETMGSDGSGEDMEVSEDEVQVDDAVSSDNGRGRNQRGMSYGEDTEIDEAQEDEIDIEEEEAAVEDDDEDQEDQLSSSPSNTPPSKPTRTKGSPNKPQLKIKLKFNKAASTATPTPSDEMPIRAGRKGHPRHIESEDSEDSDSSSRSNPYVPTRLTQRQAALAGIAEQAEHLVLEETVSKKKKYLNETEAALRREETARKRKNLSVKKLEDEKTETINRLLKKQSRPRGKKGAPAPVDVEEDGEADAEETPASLPPPAIPTLFRWVSSNRDNSLSLTFSVPPSLLPETIEQKSEVTISAPAVKPTPLCDVSGCSLPRKYKLVKDPSRGGCGMEHLKALQVN